MCICNINIYVPKHFVCYYNIQGDCTINFNGKQMVSEFRRGCTSTSDAEGSISTNEVAAALTIDKNYDMVLLNQ